MRISYSRCVDVNLRGQSRNSNGNQYNFILAPVSSWLLSAGCGDKLLRLCEPREDIPNFKTHHIFNLDVPITEDNGIWRIPNWQHNRKRDTHGDRNQGVQRVDKQGFWLERKRERGASLT